ncbi:MAG: cobalamin-dependent protein [Campylobacterota bacterium]|nr:cobalamin-dependent protein [Campylobacterota bacterium]
MQEIINDFENALLSLNRIKVKDILVENTTSGDFIDTLEQIVVPTMESMGLKWENGEIALSQIYMGGRICEEIVDEMLPKTKSKRVDDPNLGLVVFNDYHTLGKRIVYTFLRASGYDLVDYGQENSIDNLITHLKEDKIEILLVSVLMLNSALHLKELIARIQQEGMSVKVVVGGAPFRFDKDLYKEIGADAMATNASKVIDVIEALKDQS